MKVLELMYMSKVSALILCALASGCEMSSRATDLMKREKCFDCHTISGKGGSAGPNLTSVGSRRTREFITEQIKRPSSHNPESAMPSFKDRLSEQEIGEIADYLSRRK